MRSKTNDFIHKKLRAPYALHMDVLQSPRKPRKTVILLHGIGSSTLMWQKTAQEMPRDVKVIAVDLLGFGQSPQPDWIKYDAQTQARSIVTSLLLRRVPLGCVIVGHSLGALVAVELARRAPWYASELVLISPPIYKPSRNKIIVTQRDDILRSFYKVLHRTPKNTERALSLARRQYIRRTGNKVSGALSARTFLAALEASVINQSTIEHIGDVKKPITIISGSRDPLIVMKNLRSVASTNHAIEHIVVKKAGHNVVGIMQHAVINHLHTILDRERAIK